MIKHVHKTVDYLNTSKYFTGIMMIMLNIGSKYITVKLSKSQEAYIRNYILREILIFSVCWMGTRDIYTSLILTAVFFVLTQHLFNEDSRFCILPKRYREFHLFDTNQDGEVSQQEINDAVNLLTKAKKQKSALHREKLYDYFQKNKV
jgi:hypothetical protein